MKWLEYIVDDTRRGITTYNIFSNGLFLTDVENLKKRKMSKEKFAEELRGLLFYYYGSKFEYEVYIEPLMGGSRYKADIYTRVMNNWDIFLDYVYGK